MSAASIEIRNFKSIKFTKLDLTNINCILGQNGVGKSNILKAIEYYYSNLTENKLDSSKFDKKNPYCRFLEITIVYNFSRIQDKIEKMNFNPDLDHKLRRFVWRFISFSNKFLKEDKTCSITLRQNRDGKQSWILNGTNYEDEYDKEFFQFRSLIKNMFPLFCVNARDINLTDWHSLWDIIGDVGRLNFSNDKIDDCLKDGLKDKYKTIIDVFNKSFKKSDIKVKGYSSKELYASIYKLQYHGDIFTIKDSNLDFFSDGSNSYNYIRILGTIISNISPLKLKDPIIVLDEPEMGLYPKLIDNLSEEFLSFSKNTQLILSTHSSRLIRNILKSNADCSIFHVFADRQYTNIKKMKDIEDKKEKYRITEKEANYYFSSFILFVEGDTELQLFQNEVLLKLFPDLRNIDIAQGCSNDVILNLSLPTKRNTNIPYVLLLDLDKLIAYNNKTNKFAIKHRTKINPLSSENNRLHEREKFFYGSKRFRTYNNRKRINGIVGGCQFHFDKNWFYINDELFFEFKKIIHEYSLEYNVFTLDTTIEGVIINRKNYLIFYEWLIQWGERASKKTLIHDILNVDFIEDTYLPFYKLTILRLLFSGKYDNLNNIIKFNDKTADEYDIDEYAKNIYDKIAAIGPIKKTDGWIDNFLDYFYKKYIKDLKTRDEKKETFTKYFPELYSIIKRITNYTFY